MLTKKTFDMKRFSFLFLLLSFVGISAQCIIEGPASLQVGEKQIYTVLDKSVSCSTCYQWSHGDQKIILDSNTNKDSLLVKGAVPGNAVLSLNFTKPEGFEKCEKTIQITAGKELRLTTEKCKIAVSEIKFVKSGDKLVTFSPAETLPNYMYSWSVIYADGTKQTSREKNPQIKVSSEMPIMKVDLVISSDQCTRKISTNYESYFWLTY